MMTRGKKDKKQLQLELVMLEQLVKKDHDLRKIDKYINFDFIYDLVEPFYAEDKGRPSIDPVVLFKMSLIQALDGIRSEEKLVDAIHHNMAYRWFLGYGLTEPIPDHSTISHNRAVRFKDSNIYEDIFNEIVLKAIDHGFVNGKIVYTDSTHVKANASNSKYESIEETRVIKEDESLLKLVNDKRISKGQKPLEPAEPKTEVHTRKASKTDPDSGYMHRDRKPVGFYHLVHGTVDSANKILLSAHVTPGNIHDSTVYMDNLEEMFERLELAPKYAGADAGYFNLDIIEELTSKGITPVIGPRRYASKRGKKSKYWFEYYPEEDTYRCFEGKELRYRTTTRQGYVEYRSDKEVCKNCPKREKCLYESSITGEISPDQTRIIRRHIKEHYADEVRSFMKTEKGKKLYQRRKETIERAFADLKELMGMRYAHYRGSHGVKSQVLMTGVAYNAKKIARLLDKQENPQS
ncbi:IS1182 family transposase [Gudongella sp. DL1XJH-153]|uniref:IS1182 family transposase n=1 Tax=Gudongella sp. DL1XJH-153 TaxID=3409804 RepID=UPI003BB5D842